MAQIRISQLATLTTITGDDLLVIVQSGSAPSLTTFRVSVQSLNDGFFSLSGSVLSASLAQFAINSTSASYIPSASYAKTSSFIEFLKYDGGFNGTASNAVSSSWAHTSSVAINAVSASIATSASLAINANSASFVLSSSFSLLTLLAQTASFVKTSSFAETASYINLGTFSTNIPKWYGPFTASGYSGSKWGWTDPIERGIPICVLHDDTDITIMATCNIMNDADSSGGLHTLQVRLKPISASTNVGVYDIPSTSEVVGTSDDFQYIMSWSPSYFSYNHTLTSTFKKTGVKRGSYILWFYSRVTRKAFISNKTIGNIVTDRAYYNGSGDAIPSQYYLYDQAPSISSDEELECWIWPTSGSVKALVYANNEVKQGIMFAPTASISFRSSPSPRYDFIGRLFAGSFGRVYALPFLVTAGAISNGNCRASFTYTSASSIYTASFSASAGSTENAMVVAYLGSIPSVATNWKVLSVTQGALLSQIPIRTDVSSSWVAT